MAGPGAHVGDGLADVQALGTAIEGHVDPSALLQTLETDIARLPSGDLRKMLRVAAGQMRSALAEPQRRQAMGRRRCPRFFTR